MFSSKVVVPRSGFPRLRNPPSAFGSFPLDFLCVNTCYYWGGEYLERSELFHSGVERLLELQHHLVLLDFLDSLSDP